MKIRKNIPKVLVLWLLFVSLVTGDLFKGHIYADEAVIYKAFDGYIMPADEYLSYQWAYNNDGTLSYNDRTGGVSTLVNAVNDVDIDMNEAWAVYSGGKRETVVAVIDTGIDYNHEDLKDILWVNKGEIPENGIDDDGNGYIDDVNGWNFYDDNNLIYTGEYDMHGTHIAGTIIANINGKGISGIVGSSTVRVMVLKALGGADKSGNTYSIEKAIKYAEANGAVICNFSFGTEAPDKLLSEAMKNSKMLFVVAAGNGDEINKIGYDIDVKPIYPASFGYDNIISVANLQSDGKLHISSNYGVNSVDIAAPGSRILSTVDSDYFTKYAAQYNLPTPYAYRVGTSMAVPMAVGAAAFLHSEFPKITVSQIKEALLGSAKPISELSGKVLTGGCLSIKNAIDYCNNNYTEIFNRPDEPENDDKEVESTAPVIKLKNIKKNTVTVKVTDKEDDIVAIKYVTGSKKASYFKSGKKGISVKVNKSGNKTLKLKKGKTYTFYAIDSEGRETIKKIKVKR